MENKKSFYKEIYDNYKFNYDYYKNVPDSQKIDLSKFSLEEKIMMPPEGTTAGEIKKQINSCFNLIKETKVFKIKVDDLLEKQYSMEKIKLPFEKVFIEFDQPIEVTRDAHRNTKDFIKAVIVSKIKTKDEEYRLSKVPEPFKDYVKKTWDTAIQVLILYEDMGDWVMNFELVDNHLSVIDPNQTPEYHLTYCNCIEANIHKELKKTFVASLPEGIKINENSHLPLCPQLRGWNNIGSMIYTTISAINDSEIEYVDTDKKQDYCSTGNSPIVMTIKVKPNKVYNKSVNTGNGTQHRYKYDVRGHFRKLSSGKVIWIDNHIRGIKNQEYVNKNYIINIIEKTQNWWLVVKNWFKGLIIN